MTHILGTGSHQVLCLNGWFGHATGWGEFGRHLNTDDFTWIFPDYRGYGTRLQEPGEYTLDEITTDNLSVVETLDPNTPLSILGHSMGGVFAQHLLTRISRPVTAFVGISPVPASGTPLPPDQRQLFASAGSDAGARRTIIDITTGSRLSSTWLDHMAHATTENSADEAVSGYFRAWADCDFLAELRNVELPPALAIVGEKDPAVTKEAVLSTYGQVFRDLTVTEYPDAGHYAMDETPIRLVTDVEAFLLDR